MNLKPTSFFIHSTFPFLKKVKMKILCLLSFISLIQGAPSKISIKDLPGKLSSLDINALSKKYKGFHLLSPKEIENVMKHSPKPSEKSFNSATFSEQDGATPSDEDIEEDFDE